MERRPTQTMPTDIAEILAKEGLLSDYADRPHYQRNDYLGWIGRAKRSETRLKRIRQMTEELRVGGVYMGMPHGPSSKN